MAVGVPELSLDTSEQSLVFAQLRDNKSALLLWVQFVGKVAL